MAQTMFITGTSTGIGRATVEWFSKKSWNVAATMRTPEKEQQLGRHKGKYTHRKFSVYKG